MITMDKTFGDIWHVSEKAIQLAKDRLDDVSFEFNGIMLKVSPRSDVNDIALIFDLKNQINGLNRTIERNASLIRCF